MPYRKTRRSRRRRRRQKTRRRRRSRRRRRRKTMRGGKHPGISDVGARVKLSKLGIKSIAHLRSGTGAAGARAIALSEESVSHDEMKQWRGRVAEVDEGGSVTLDDGSWSLAAWLDVIPEPDAEGDVFHDLPDAEVAIFDSSSKKGGRRRSRRRY